MSQTTLVRTAIPTPEEMRQLVRIAHEARNEAVRELLGGLGAHLGIGRAGRAEAHCAAARGRAGPCCRAG